MLRHVAVALLVIAAAACGGKSSASQSTVPSNKAEAPADRAASDDVLAFLPVDADLVMGLDGKALRKSALWRQFEPQIVASLGNKLTKVRDACGFDPLSSIDSATVGGKVDDNEKFDGVIVVRGVVGDKVLECMAKESEANAAVSTEHGVLTIDRGAGEKLAVTIVGSTTMVMQMGAAASAQSLDSVLARGAPLRSSKAFMALFDRREPGAAVWGMLNGKAPFMAGFSQLGASPKSIDGTLVVTERFLAAARITFATPADAAQVEKQFAQILPMMSGRVDKLDAHADGAILRFELVATDAQVKAILDMLGGF